MTGHKPHPPSGLPKAPPQRNERHIVSEEWSGPLPPPGALAQFNAILPNGAERIMQMVEQEQAHRIETERMIIQAEIDDTRLGKRIGAVMTLACVGGAIYVAHIGAPWQIAAAIVGVPVMALIDRIVHRR